MTYQRDDSPGEPDMFDAVRRPVGSTLAYALTSNAPGDRLLAESGEQLARLAEASLRHGPGFLVLTGIPAEPEAGRRAAARAGRMLGVLVPQDKEGTLVRAVQDRGTAVGEGRRSRYADSNMGGHLHTDGAEMAFPVPDVFVLFCVRQSPAGGAFQVLHVRDLRRALGSRPEIIEVLSRPFQFDRRGDEPPGECPTVAKPVLFERAGRPAITYLRRYIEIGHDHSGSPKLSDEQRAALEAVDNAAADRHLVRQGKLQPGELALFDNLSLLHGRTHFVDHPDTRRRRLLLRIWVQVTSWTGEDGKPG